MMKIQTSSVFRRLRNSKKRIIVMEGSSRSTKTFSIIQWIIMRCLTTPGLRVTICRAKLTWLKGSVIPDFLEVIDKHFGLYDAKAWNKSDCIYTLNKCTISFVGLDEAQKMHGRKQDIFWINEAVECELKEFQQLVIRTTERGILDYNPSYETHWIYDKVIPRDDAELIHSTYKNNHFLSQA